MNLIRTLLDFLLPRYCKVCGKRLSVGEEHICIACFISLPYYNSYNKEINDIEELLMSNRRFVCATSLLSYDKESNYRRLLYHLKYYNHPDVGRYLADIAAKRLQERGFFDGIDIIVQMPISRSKMKIRGYNQSWYIAKGISEYTGVPIADNLISCRDNLQQAGKGKLERWGNAEGRFTLSGSAQLIGKHILLVDDVITTGSTMNALISAIELSVEDVVISVFTLAVAK